MTDIKPKDLLGSYDLKVDIGKSMPACMECLPPAPMEDHKSLYGVLIHSRIDCLPYVLYSSTNEWLLEGEEQPIEEKYADI